MSVQSGLGTAMLARCACFVVSGFADTIGGGCFSRINFGVIKHAMRLLRSSRTLWGFAAVTHVRGKPWASMKSSCCGLTVPTHNNAMIRPRRSSSAAAGVVVLVAVCLAVCVHSRPAAAAAATAKTLSTGHTQPPQRPDKPVCPELHFREQCTPQGCVWCQNK